MCAEIGGINALLPLVLAARCGLPLVDGDGMGRAFPQLQMTTYHIGGVSAGPMIMADEYCNAVVINSDRAIEIERLGRSMVVAMGGSTNICLYPMHGDDAKRTLVRGTVSLALELGRTVREARGGGGDPFAALLRVPARHAVLPALPGPVRGQDGRSAARDQGRLGARQGRDRRHRRLRRPPGDGPVPERTPRRARGRARADDRAGPHRRARRARRPSRSRPRA